MKKSDQPEDEPERIEELEAQVEQLQSQVSEIMPSRRDVLKLGGAAGAGALAYSSATGGASAQTAVGQIGDPNNRVDIYADAIDANSSVYDSIEADDNLSITSLTASDSISTEDTKLGNRWANVSPLEAAPEVATQDLDIHVSPSGNDSNDGSQNSPVATLSEACSRIPKRILGHSVRLYLDYGDYSSGVGIRLHSHDLAPQSGTDAPLKIIGHDSRNPYYDSNNSVSDITVPQIQLGNVRGNEEMDIVGIQVDGFLQAYDAVANVVDCEFINGALSPSRLVSGYLFFVMFDNCTFDGADIVAVLNRNASAKFRDCSASNIASSPYQASHNSVIGLENSGSIFNNPPNSATVDKSSIVMGAPNSVNHFSTNGDGWAVNGNTQLPLQDTVDISGSRTSGTVYQNTTGGRLHVSVIVEIDGSSTAATMSAQLFSSSSSSPSGSSDRIDWGRIDNYDDRYYYTLKGIVPDTHYYKVETLGSGSINSWQERTEAPN